MRPSKPLAWQVGFHHIPAVKQRASDDQPGVKADMPLQNLSGQISIGSARWFALSLYLLVNAIIGLLLCGH
jgi:hypothetical protein